MLRSIFYNVGLFIVLCGAGLLYVDTIVLNIHEDVIVGQQTQSQQVNSFRGMFTAVSTDGKKVIIPPPWAPYSMMSIGAVALLYATALPRRSGN